MIETLPLRPRVVDRSYLLVCDGDKAWVIDLPARGTIAIGRSSECQIVLADTGASRVHAVLELGDAAILVDRGSQNGTRVGGRAIDRHALVAGDVIEVGGATLVFHTTARSRAARRVEAAAFTREIEREIERTHASKRGFVVLAIGAADADRACELVAANLRAFETATLASDHEVLVLCPEHDGGAAPLAAQLATLVSVLGPTRVGWAGCPHDGVDAGALLAAARTERAADPPAAPPRIRAGSVEIVVAEPATRQLYALVERLARSELPVLVRGETGVGKEVVAQALHAWSPRAKSPFVAINCAALPEQLAESELFGHDKGAFSGAIAAKPGLLESARGGTVLLDEVGDMTLATQAKLLRALETKRITRLGSVEEREIDIRLVAATHRDLEADVAAGRFRQDLYFRIGGGTLVLPPLRDRPRELVLLAETFLAAACSSLARQPLVLSNDAILELVAYAWPGNVRELKHVMDYLAAAEPGRTLSAAHVALRLGATRPAVVREASGDREAPGERGALRDEVEQLERRRITEALASHAGHQANAAAAIGVPLRTFVAKLKRYRIASVRKR